MPIPQKMLKDLKDLFDVAVVGPGYRPMLDAFYKDSFDKDPFDRIEEYLRDHGNDSDRHDYARILYQYALISDSNHTKSIHCMNGFRDDRNARDLFQKASEFCPLDDPASLELRAIILIGQANFFARTANPHAAPDSSRSNLDLMRPFQKTPQEIIAIYEEAFDIGCKLPSGDWLVNKASDCIRAQSQENASVKQILLDPDLKKVPDKFDIRRCSMALASVLKEDHPAVANLLIKKSLIKENAYAAETLLESAKAMGSKLAELKLLLTKLFATLNATGSPGSGRLAGVQIMPNGNIQIDPIWAKFHSSVLVENLLTKPDLLGLKEGRDFSVQRHKVRSDKFIIEPGEGDKNFDRWIDVIKVKLNALQKQGYSIKEGDQAKTQPQPRESNVSSISPVRASRDFIADRFPPMSDSQINKIQIPGWKLQKDSSNHNEIKRFVQSTNNNTYIDIDKRANKISSNTASVDTFVAMFKAFQAIYGNDKTMLPVVTLSGAANNQQSKNNCEIALRQSGYDDSQIKKVMHSFSVSVQRSVAAPAANQPSVDNDEKPQSRRLR
jgi:hypothetical protein